MSTSIEVKVEVELTGTQMGAAFWRLNADEQADFFHALVAEAGLGPKLHAQMQYAAERATVGARAAMEIIGASVDA